MSRRNILPNIANKGRYETEQDKDRTRRGVPTLDPEDDPSACYIETTSAEARQYLAPVTVPEFTLPETDRPQDIDAMDLGNPYTVAVYATEAYDHLSQLQEKLKPNPNYMQMQIQITAALRARVVDWLIDLHRELSHKYQTSLQADTLFITISLLDRFLSRKPISAEKLHLVGLGCFFIAAKFEETYYPSVEQLLQFAPQIGTKEDLLKMERIILNELRYSLGCPNPLTFLKRYAKAANADSSIGMVARFLAEYSMMSYSLATQYLPSQIAAAAISHALRIVGRPPWTATLQYYSGYSYQDIYPILVKMKQWVRKAPILRTQAAFRKYSAQKYLKASLVALIRI